MKRGLHVGDHVTRICATLPGGLHRELKHGVVTHRGPIMAQVQWDDGKRGKYPATELTFVRKEET